MMLSSHSQIPHGAGRNSQHLNPIWRRFARRSRGRGRDHLHGDTRRQWESEAVFGYALTTIGGLVTLKFQCKGCNPFETHPMLMDVSVLAMLLSFSASTVVMIHPSIAIRAARILAHVSIFSGALALALLGSVVLHSKFRWAAFLLCGSPWALLLIRSLKLLLKRVRQRTVEAIHITLHVLGQHVALNHINLPHGNFAATEV